MDPSTKIPHHETQTPPHSPTINLISFPTGKTNHHPPLCTAVTYRECLKNHAAGIGGHAVDGCGEFMPSPTYSPSEPSSYQCAACGCHRNFHRREPTKRTTNSIDFHRPSPPSPPGEHLVLSLRTVPEQNHTVATPGTPVAMKISTGRKRFRTKFSNDQKEKMLSFAEKVGWKMQRCDDKMVVDFCNEIGIRRRVFKVWMHNNKNTLARRENNTTTATTTVTGSTAVAGDLVRSNDSVHQEHGSSSSS